MSLSDWRLQFRVRELFALPMLLPKTLCSDEMPYCDPVHAVLPAASDMQLLTGGLISGDSQSEFKVVNRLLNAVMFMDGSSRAHPLAYNDTLTFHRSKLPLHWIAPVHAVPGLKRPRLQIEEAPAHVLAALQQQESIGESAFEQVSSEDAAKESPT